jgi:hypothetical protein
MRSDETASSSSITFAVAVSITLVSIFAVFQSTEDVVSLDAIMEVEQINLQSEAANLKHILLSTP